jgi:hypothetical protein
VGEAAALLGLHHGVRRRWEKRATMMTWLGCGGSPAQAAPIGGAMWSTGIAALLEW